MLFFRTFFMIGIWALICLDGHAAEAPGAYFSHAELRTELKQLVQTYPNLLRVETIGRTVQDREIQCLSISNFKPGNPDEKRGICVIANISGNYLSGSFLAQETARYLLAQFGKNEAVTQLLNERIFYFIPTVNPDAAERFFQSPRIEQKKNLTPRDDDFDALIDEDGPDDLNGDGWITQMRIPDPKGTWVVDSTENRLLRPVRPGEIGQFRLETEGEDNDRDELINEDPAGGVNLNHNFPQNYPQYHSDAGAFMLSEPESRAVVHFLTTHSNIVFSIIYDEFDNLLVPPEFRSEKEPNSATKIDPADAFIYHKASEIYRKITGLKIKSTVSETPGSLAQWLYFQCGTPVFCARPVWPAPTDSTATDSGKNGSRVRKPKALETSDADWLRWTDAGLPDGFVDWKPFPHPQLGAIEIGGFRPFVKSAPPIEKLTTSPQQAIEFTQALGQLLPGIRLAKIDIQKPEKNIFKLKIEVQKTGFLPLSTAFAYENPLVKSSLVRLELNDARLLSGTINTRLPHLVADGQTESVEWIIFAPKPTTIGLEILTEKAGNIRQEIQLK